MQPRVLGELRRSSTRLEIRASFDPNDDPMMTMTAVRWTNDVSSAETDGATGPPALPMGTSTVEEGRYRLE